MRREITKVWMVLAIAGLASATALAGDVQALRVKVPFSFTVGDSTVPAGDYQLRRSWSSGALHISSHDQKVALSVLPQIGGKNATGHANALVFNKYGEKHYLREVWSEGQDGGLLLPSSRSEKEELLARQPIRKMLVVASAQ